MARKRDISPGFFLNESLSEVDPLGRILFAGLWCYADRNGRLEHRPKRIKAEILPYDDITSEQVETWLQQLASRLLISFYQVGSNKFIQITNFTKYQSPHPGEKPVHPEPPVLPESNAAVSVQAAQLSAEVEQNQEITENHLQASGQQVTSNLQENDQQRSYSLTLLLSNSNSNLEESNTEEKSAENMPNSANSTAPTLKPTSPVEAVFIHWKEICNHPKAVLDAKRRRAIQDRLKQFSVEDCKRAIEGCKASPWHQGANDRHKVFDDIELIFRDAKHVEEFIRVLEKTPSLARDHLARTGHQSVPKTAGNIAQMETWLNSRRANNG